MSALAIGDNRVWLSALPQKRGDAANNRAMLMCASMTACTWAWNRPAAGSPGPDRDRALACLRRYVHASIALELDDDLDVSRGDLLVRAGEAPAVVSRIAADVAWLADAPLDSRRTYLLRHATREVRARVESLAWRWDVETQTREVHPSTLEANGIGRVALMLGAPIATDDYRAIRPTGAFLLIDETTHATVAAGMVHA